MRCSCSMPTLAAAFMLAGLVAAFMVPAMAADVKLVAEGHSDFVIFPGPSPDDGTEFAAAELQAYVEKITGHRLEIVTERPAGAAIAVGSVAAMEYGRDVGLLTVHEDGFVRSVEPALIVLAGKSRRATLYAVYDLLEAIGCRWFAPRFSHYEGRAEFVPTQASVSLPAGQAVAAPTMRLRYKRVEEGISHDSASLVQLVDWMAKSRHNALNVPIDYGQEGRSVWDKWRDALIPEIDKRGILIDVGGHGYENFLPPEKYAKQHPEWYGMLDGRRQPDMRRVNFNTAHPDAVRTLIANLREFLRAHPEVDILTLLPPDTAQWDTSPESMLLGSVAARHARLVNEIVHSLNGEFPRMQYLVHAYQGMIVPPQGTTLPPNVLVSLAPIRRQDSVPILDVSEQKNLYYLNYLWKWLDAGYTGVLGFGPYYSRYAWRSLPVIQPSVIAADTRYMALNGLQMGGSYSEPGNWFTHEINHYIYGRMMWDPREPLDLILDDYARHRFGDAHTMMRDLIFMLEAFAGQVTRSYANYRGLASDVPFPELRTQELFIEPVAGYQRHLALCQSLLAGARQVVRDDPGILSMLDKWALMLQYLELELEAKWLAERIAGPAPIAQLVRELNATYREMERLIGANIDRGVFLTADKRSQYAIDEPPH